MTALAGTSRWSGRQFTAGVVQFGIAALILAGLLALGFDSTTLSIAAIGIAGIWLATAVFGAEAVGIGFLVLAYSTAPMYKGLASSPSATVTPTDALLAVGFLFLLPRILSGRVHFPTAYTVGILLVLFTASIGAVATGTRIASDMVSLGLWVGVLAGLPLLIGLWNPSERLLIWLASAFIAGQMFDTGYALAVNHSQRWTGLAAQPNYFAEGGLLALTMVMFIENKLSGWRRGLALFAAIICCVGVVQSGSRAGAVVLAAVVILFPLLERSARLILSVGGAVIVGLMVLLITVPSSGGTNVLSRLAGGGSAQGSDQARTQGLQGGLKLFTSAPFTGHGLDTSQLFNIHNNYLEVAVVGGVFCFGGYVLALWVLARPLVAPLRSIAAPGTRMSSLRRLGYPVLAYIGFGATVPSLVDRSIWCLVALSILVYQPDRSTEDPHPSDSTTALLVPGEESKV